MSDRELSPLQRSAIESNNVDPSDVSLHRIGIGLSTLVVIAASPILVLGLLSLGCLWCVGYVVEQLCKWGDALPLKQSRTRWMRR